MIENSEAFLIADVELHDAIREAAGNAILGRFMESIHALGLASRRATGTHRRCASRAPKDHRVIVAALRAPTAAAAADAMHIHLENVAKARAVTRIVDLTLQIGEDTL